MWPVAALGTLVPLKFRPTAAAPRSMPSMHLMSGRRVAARAGADARHLQPTVRLALQVLESSG